MDRIATLQAWLADKPEDRFALYSLALELQKAGRLPEAIACLEKLLAVHATSGAGHYQLGQMHLAAGDPQRARLAWEAGLVALSGVRDADARRSISEIQAALDALDDD